MSRTRMIATTLVMTGLGVGFALGAGPGSMMGQGGNDQSSSMNTADRCAKVTQMRERMMNAFQEDDAKLQKLVAAMDSATGQAKVDAMAAVIDELVAQRTQERSRVMAMDQSMMSHMMKHMEASAPEDMQQRMQQWMENCPAIQQMHRQQKQMSHGMMGHGGMMGDQ